MTIAIRTWLEDERGASAVEVALLLTPLTLLVFGVVHLCLMMYSAQQLNFATEATARCVVTSASSNYASAPCWTSTAATSYFRTLYKGITATPSLTFCSGTYSDCTISAYACTGSTGNYQVTATVNYVINAGIASKTVPLTAKACFPHT
jgi:Flp pilus assembly protein TadG